MKLIIQIPCFNEAETLPHTLSCLPRAIRGVDEIEYLIVDDGSTDATSDIARISGAHHLIRMTRHRGLAAAFRAGLEASLQLGADLIVNTDADNQYAAEDIHRLLEPILDGKADIAIGDRGVATLEAFSPVKRRLQTIGSRVISRASGMEIPDATSGFRALTREAALKTIVVSNYSYTLETLIQAGANKMAVVSVPVRTNPKVRPSRLMRSISEYLINSGATILRSYTMYRPLWVFTILGLATFLFGLFWAGRYLYYAMVGQGAGHIQSVILAAVLLIVGFQIGLIGLLADLIGFNRKMLEEALFRLRKVEITLSEEDTAKTREEQDGIFKEPFA